MASITIRNPDGEIKRKLHIRAAQQKKRVTFCMRHWLKSRMMCTWQTGLRAL